MTESDNQRTDLVIKYRGPRGGNCRLVIRGFDGNIEIRQLLQDPKHQPEWKIEYLAGLYEEQIRQPNEAKHHRYRACDYTMSHYMYIDAYGIAHHTKNFKDSPDYFAQDTVQGFELALENESVLQQLLSELTPEQRERTQLFYLEGYSYTEIAEMQGVSPTAVRNSINRGFEVIRKKFHDPVQKRCFSCLQSERENKKSPSQKEVNP
jgi:RNA polymerase sigma factor (sigma-70 family)